MEETCTTLGHLDIIVEDNFTLEADTRACERTLLDEQNEVVV